MYGDLKSDDVKRGKLKFWWMVVECIDFLIVCLLIFDIVVEIFEKYGLWVVWLLVKNMMVWVVWGMKCYVLEWVNLFFVFIVYGDSGGWWEYLFDDFFGVVMVGGIFYGVVMLYVMW